MWFKAIGYVFAVMLFLEALLNAMGYIPKDPTNQAKKGVSAFSLQRNLAESPTSVVGMKGY